MLIEKIVLSLKILIYYIMKNKKFDNKNLFILFVISAQTLLLSNLISLYTLTQYKASKFNNTLRSKELVGPFFRPHDTPGVGYDMGAPSVGYHFFGDLTELMFYAKNVSQTINYFDLNIQYPTSTLLFLKIFQDVEIKNLLFFLFLFSLVLITYGIKNYDLSVNKPLFVFTFIVLSRPFLFSVDRGNLEFVVFSLIFSGLAMHKANKKLSIVLFIFAICLKPSAGLMLIFLKLPSLLSVILGFLVIQLSSYLYLRINPLDGFLHYLSNLSSFSQTYPYPIDVDISNLSFWTLLNNIRHSDLFLLNPIGVFLQGLINNGNLVAVISVVLYFLLIKFLKVDIYDSHIYFAGYIAITVMLREFTGYYGAIYFVIPLVLLFRKHKLDLANLIFGIFVFITIQPIQIFISKNYLMQYENLQTLYRFSSSFNVLIVFLICGSLILFDINKSLKN